jgi:hypothetical protein
MKTLAAVSVGLSLGVLGLLLAAGRRKPTVIQLPPMVVKAPPPPNAPARTWKPITTKQAKISAGNAYAAVIQLDGIKATFGDAGDVEAELRKLCDWVALTVSDKPIKAKFPVPWTAAAASDRYWALGVAGSNAIAADVPAEVVQLFER